MTKTGFIDCFWGSDFNSTAGFDTLCKRMRDGKQTCMDFEEFIKQRAEVEERYGKSLLKIAKIGESGVEIGSLKQSWDMLRLETENIGRAHVELSQQLMEQLERAVREFREEQKNKRKPIEENVKKAQKEKKLCFDNNLKAKRNYEQKCKDQDACEETLKKFAAQQSSKEEEKFRQRLSRAKTAMENADANYQTTVKLLEESRKEWEREMASCCNTFQELEVERISFLRNSFWTYTNLGSANCVRADKNYEEIRKSLENCDIDSDIRLFVSAKQTGGERPAEILYENFYTAQSSQKTGLPSQQWANHPKARVSLPPTPSATPQKNAQDYDDIEDDPTYSTVQDLKKRPPVKMVKAEFDYTAQGAEELSFREGDIIKVIYQEDDTWWHGEFRGRKGVFPREFVSVVK